MSETPMYALSIRQPWAGLVIQGLKIIEVRRWRTQLRGKIYIHAARLVDERSQGWNLVTPDLKPWTDLRGGLIGTLTMTDCIAYRSSWSFLRDCQLHRNDPLWYAPGLYGFRFEAPCPMPFQPLSGQTRFFKVPELVNRHG